jgi:hypothetical protein
LVRLEKKGYLYLIRSRTLEEKKEVHMFANVCTTCGKQELVFTDQIRSLRETAHGFDVRYVCSCGATATWRVERAGATPAATAA